MNARGPFGHRDATVMGRKHLILALLMAVVAIAAAVAIMDEESEDSDALSSSYTYYYIHDPANRITVDLNNSGALGPYGSKANDDFHYKVPAGKTIKLSTSYNKFYRWLQVSGEADYTGYHYENPQTISGSAGYKYDIWMLYYDSTYEPTSNYATYAMLKTPCATSFNVNGSNIGEDTQFVYYRVTKNANISVRATSANATINEWHQKNYETNGEDSFSGASVSIDNTKSTVYFITPQYTYSVQSYFSVTPSSYEVTPGSSVTITASDKVDPAVLTWQVTKPNGTVTTLSDYEGCKKFTYTLSSGSGSYTFKATQTSASNTASTTVSAIEYKIVTFTVNNSSYGSLSSSTGASSTSTTTLTVPSGSTISVSGNTVTIDGKTVTANPKSADSSYTYAFSSWTNASGTVTSNKTITANFTAESNTVSITVYRGNWYSFKWVGGSDSTTYTTSSHTYTVPIGTTFDIDWYGKAAESGGSQASGSTWTKTYDASNYYMAYSSYGTSQGDNVTASSSHTKIYPSVTMGDSTVYTYYFTISYSANGGSGAPSSTNGGSSSSTTKSVTLSSTTPTRSGYTFLGWSTSSTATSASYSAGGTYSFSYGTTTLYAVWQQNTYTCYLYYNANSGTGAPGDQSYTGTSTSSHSFTIASGTPTRSGYTFLGWAESSTATAATYQPGGTISVPYNGQKTLYAVWQQQTVTFTGTPAVLAILAGSQWSYTPVLNTDGCTITTNCSWLTVSNGTISGSTSNADTYSVTVTASKTGWTSGSQTFTITVVPVMDFISDPTSGTYLFSARGEKKWIKE